MSLLSEFVFDPIENLIRKALASSDPVVAAAAPGAAAVAKPAPASATSQLVTDLETSMRTLVDGVITSAVDHVPVVGELIAPDAVAEANKGLAYVEAYGVAFLGSLVASAKAKLASAVAPA